MKSNRSSKTSIGRLIMAWQLGFDFVDVKHCHGYLGHEFLSAHTREGRYGGSFEGRTRFLREVVQGIRSLCPGLHIGVRLSAIDTVPFQSDPSQSVNGKSATGVAETSPDLIPYRWGFGVNPLDPTDTDLSEPRALLILVGGTWNSAGEHHRRQPLLQSAHPTPGAVSAFRRISATRRPFGWSCAADGGDPSAQAAVPEPAHRRIGIHLSAGFPAARGAGRSARGMGRLRGAWAGWY